MENPNFRERILSRNQIQRVIENKTLFFNHYLIDLLYTIQGEIIRIA